MPRITREQLSVGLIESARRRFIERAIETFDTHDCEMFVNEINRVCDKLINDVESGELLLAIPDSPWQES